MKKILILLLLFLFVSPAVANQYPSAFNQLLNSTNSPTFNVLTLTSGSVSGTLTVGTLETSILPVVHQTALAATTTSIGSDIAEASVISVTVASTGEYEISGVLTGNTGGAAYNNTAAFIKVGHPIYTNAGYVSSATFTKHDSGEAQAIITPFAIVLNMNDTVHLGGFVTGFGGGVRQIYGQDVGAAYKKITSLYVKKLK